MGNICRNCVSEIIKIKKDDNEKTICMYECPFCKTVNDNILPHICGLNKEEFNNLIDKKVNEFNEEYRENTDDIMDDYRQTIDNLHVQTQDLSYRLFNTEHMLKLQKNITEEREKARLNLAIQLECKQTTINNLQSEKKILHENLKNKNNKIDNLKLENNSLSNENDKLKLKLKTLEKQLKLSNLPKDRYYCRCCDKEMKLSSKYAHLKCKTHIKKMEVTLINEFGYK